MNHNLKLYCDTTRLSELRHFLGNVLEGTALTEVDQHQVILAVEEVCANLIIHSHECNPQECIDLTVKESDELMIFEIKDFGQGFNILEYQEPEISFVMKTKRKGGLGIILVKRIMDKIEFETKANINICRLFKILKSK
jgi:serine/threonine-protein kinase RsbW